MSVPELVSVVLAPMVFVPANTQEAPVSTVPLPKSMKSAWLPVSVPVLAPEVNSRVLVP